jgi:glycosyltransferase involved in cell wall biosynthesis
MVFNRGLVLYTRLPDYFFQSLIHFCKIYSYYCDVIVYEGDENTAFDFPESDFLKFKSRKDFIVSDFLNRDYKFIYTSTWNDKSYNKVCLNYRDKVPVIIGMDNPWTGNLKQRIHCLISSFTVLRYFNSIWIPGTPQRYYAKKLGFLDFQIHDNLYTADNHKFFKDRIQKECNKSILFVGRFVEYKKAHLLAEVFNELLVENKINKDWKLILTGRGPLSNVLESFRSENIIIKDFVSPNELPLLLNSVSAFCLPSVNEHWGVVVHEAALSGLPLLLSSSVHSGSEFLEDGKNGYYFKSGSRQDLKDKLILISESDLESFGKLSKEKGLKITKETWSDILYNMIENFQKIKDE